MVFSEVGLLCGTALVGSKKAPFLIAFDRVWEGRCDRFLPSISALLLLHSNILIQRGGPEI